VSAQDLIGPRGRPNRLPAVMGTMRSVLQGMEVLSIKASPSPMETLAANAEVAAGQNCIPPRGAVEIPPGQPKLHFPSQFLSRAPADAWGTFSSRMCTPTLYLSVTNHSEREQVGSL
jgi:hypothetical protein